MCSSNANTSSIPKKVPQPEPQPEPSAVETLGKLFGGLVAVGVGTRILFAGTRIGAAAGPVILVLFVVGGVSYVLATTVGVPSAVAIQIGVGVPVLAGLSAFLVESIDTRQELTLRREVLARLQADYGRHVKIGERPAPGLAFFSLAHASGRRRDR